ncbi:MAG: hypothetical protein V4619_00230 [Bacteroidota bacterium]
MEPSLSKRTMVAQAPGSNFQSTSYAINFWWDEMEDALTYHLQVVTPGFGSVAGLVLDTVVKINRFTYTLKPGNYEWRVLAQNGSSQTPYSAPKNFTVLTTSIGQQTVQLNSPANNFLTNQANTSLQWESLYAATKYNLQIDTGNFSNENALVYNQTIPGQQINFTFIKDHAYQWRVRAVNDTAKSLWSDIRIITYDHTPPAQVQATLPANTAQVTLPVTLQWNNIAAARYKLYVFKSDSITNYSASFPVYLNTNSYNFTTGTIGDRINWKVSAIDAAGNEGQASTIRSFVLR